VRPYLEKPHHKKRAGGVARGIGPEFKPQYSKKKKKSKECPYINQKTSSPTERFETGHFTQGSHMAECMGILNIRKLKKCNTGA
jgi:hypothetical protein